MFILYANKNQLTVRKREPVTSGSVNVYTVQFEFSPDWDLMERVAVFRAGAESRSILLDDTNTCEIPWEVLARPNIQLQAGVRGTRGGEAVLPTVWAGLGIIMEGVDTGESTRPPTPELWEQELAKKGDTLDYTELGDLGLYAGDKLLSAVPVVGGGTDHRTLTSRDAENQHPISSITGLRKELDDAHPKALSVSEILKIMEA